MIVFDNVTKSYPTGTVALQDASFTFDDNDFVFLVGPSGAGKTTILKMILRATVPTAGSVSSMGKISHIPVTERFSDSDNPLESFFKISKSFMIRMFTKTLRLP